MLPYSQRLFSCHVYPCPFLWRKEKDQKKHALQLGLRLPSRKPFFRRGQELARLRRAQTACPLFPKKAFALGSAKAGTTCH
ncbi:MAG: hypothetical protein ACOZBW_09535 [Thermodesulfobacteriota bacterium]